MTYAQFLSSYTQAFVEKSQAREDGDERLAAKWHDILVGFELDREYAAYRQRARAEKWRPPGP